MVGNGNLCFGNFSEGDVRWDYMQHQRAAVNFIIQRALGEVEKKAHKRIKWEKEFIKYTSWMPDVT